MSEDSSTQMHQRLVEMQVEYILNRKRLERLIKPGHIYTQNELQELVHLASSVSAYSAVQAMMEEVASTLISKGLTATFGESVGDILPSPKRSTVYGVGFPRLLLRLCCFTGTPR